MKQYVFIYADDVAVHRDPSQTAIEWKEQAHEITMLGHLSIGLLIKLMSFCVERQQPVNYIRKCPICFQSFTKFHVKNTFIAKISIDSIHWMGRHRFEPIILVNTDLSLIDRFSISHVINAIHLFWLCLVFCFALVFFSLHSHWRWQTRHQNTKTIRSSTIYQ